MYAYLRRDGDRTAVVLLNLTPVPRHDYRAGVPVAGGYRLRLSSDHPQYGGGAFGLIDRVSAEAQPWQGQPLSVTIGLPPLGAVVLTHEPG